MRYSTISTKNVLLVICLNGCGWLASQDRISLSLQEAIELAVKNNTDLVIASYESSGAEFLVNEAKGNYLPKITLNGSYNRNIDKQVIFFPEGLGLGGVTRIGSDNNFSSGLNFSLPVFSQANQQTKAYAHSRLNLRKEVSRGTRQTVIANLKKNYFSYLISLEIVKVREKSLQNAHENLKIVQSKLLQGLATEFDETSAEVKVSSARSALIEAQSNTIIPANNLKLLLYIPSGTVLSLTDSVSLDDNELVVLKSLDNLRQNSEFMQSELNTEIARRQTAQTKAVYFPSLSATGTYQYQSQHNNFNFSEYDWVKTSSVGLTLQVPLFNGTVTRSKVQQAVIAERIAAKRKEYTARNNLAQFEQLITRLDFARQRVALQRENIALAARALEQVKERYQYGKGTMLEINNSELEYTTARLEYLQAILDYKTAYFDYELLTGKEQ